MWIPQKDDEMNIRIIFAAHTGISGTRSTKTTKKAIKINFFWHSLDQEFLLFCETCFHYLFPSYGGVILHQLGCRMDSEKPIRTLHLDYFCIGPRSYG